MDLIPAVVKDEAFIAEVEGYEHEEKNFHLWWLGQSGYLLLWKGKKILFDPYLSDSLTKKYAATDKPHVRMSERVVDPRLVKNISIVTSSHNHTDHLDAETLIPVIRNNPAITLIIPEANRDFVSERVQVSKDFPVGLNDGETTTIGEFSFHGIPAKHNEIERDQQGRCRFMGYVIRFGEWSIYHSGDTLRFENMVEILKPFKIDLALLPINGNDPTRKVAGNLDSKEAAQLAREVEARVVIPCHYDMFTFNTANPDDFRKECERIGQRYCILEPGGRFSGSILRS